MLAVILMIFCISFSAVQCDNNATVIQVAVSPPTAIASPAPSEISIDLMKNKYQPASFNETAPTNDEQPL